MGESKGERGAIRYPIAFTSRPTQRVGGDGNFDRSTYFLASFIISGLLRQSLSTHFNQHTQAPTPLPLLCRLPPIQRRRPPAVAAGPFHEPGRVRPWEQRQGEEDDAQGVQAEKSAPVGVQGYGRRRDEDLGLGEQRGEVGEAHEVAEGVGEDAGEGVAGAEEDEAFGWVGVGGSWWVWSIKDRSIKWTRQREGGTHTPLTPLTNLRTTRRRPCRRTGGGRRGAPASRGPLPGRRAASRGGGARGRRAGGSGGWRGCWRGWGRRGGGREQGGPEEGEHAGAEDDLLVDGCVYVYVYVCARQRLCSGFKTAHGRRIRPQPAHIARTSVMGATSRFLSNVWRVCPYRRRRMAKVSHQLLGWGRTRRLRR